MGINPLAELSIVIVDEDGDVRAAREVDGRAGPDRRARLPHGRAATGPAGRAADADVPTDPALLGDVVLCPQVAARQAAEAGHSTQEELELLCTHGILHLLGYDHAEPEEHKEMFGLQARAARVVAGGAQPRGELAWLPRPSSSSWSAA